MLHSHVNFNFSSRDHWIQSASTVYRLWYYRRRHWIHDLDGKCCAQELIRAVLLRLKFNFDIQTHPGIEWPNRHLDLHMVVCFRSHGAAQTEYRVAHFSGMHGERYGDLSHQTVYFQPCGCHISRCLIVVLQLKLETAKRLFSCSCEAQIKCKMMFGWC